MTTPGPSFTPPVPPEDGHSGDERPADVAPVEPAGPTVAAVLVGVLDGPANLDDPTPSLVFSPALLDDPQIGVKVTIMMVRFKPDASLILRTISPRVSTSGP